MTTYKITNMRAVLTTGKMAEKHPEQWLTVYGTFFTDNGTELSFTSKPVTFEDAKHPDFKIDLAEGILTIHTGEKGRKQYASISQDELTKQLNALRK